MRFINHWFWPLLWILVVPIAAVRFASGPEPTGICKGGSVADARSGGEMIGIRAYLCPLSAMPQALASLPLTIVPAVWLVSSRRWVRWAAITAAGLGSLASLIAIGEILTVGVLVYCFSNLRADEACYPVLVELFLLPLGGFIALAVFFAVWLAAYLRKPDPGTADAA